MPTDPAIRKRAVDLVRGGATFSDAAREVGVSDFGVRKWCKAAGVRSARAMGGRTPSTQAGQAATGAEDSPQRADGTTNPRAADAVPLLPPAVDDDVLRGEDADAGEGSPAASESGALPALLETVEDRVARRVRALAKREGRPVGQVLTRLLLEVLSRWE